MKLSLDMLVVESFPTTGGTFNADHTTLSIPFTACLPCNPTL